MPSFSQTTQIDVVDAPEVTESAAFVVAGVADLAVGTGRLIHPIIGAIDYQAAPDEWSNFDRDIIIPPNWTHTTTLSSGADLLWDGSIRDVVVTERWTSAAAMPLAQLRALIQIWTNPPDPSQTSVEWHPNYWTPIAFNVNVTSVTVRGSEVTLDGLARQGWVRGPVEMRLRLVGYA